jgi:hypothetical protein
MASLFAAVLFNTSAKSFLNKQAFQPSYVHFTRTYNQCPDLRTTPLQAEGKINHPFPPEVFSKPLSLPPYPVKKVEIFTFRSVSTALHVKISSVSVGDNHRGTGM